jgi:glyoxylase-like metal-dependent hydrolase (beta-lactamase superfamily II)
MWMADSRDSRVVIEELGSDVLAIDTLLGGQDGVTSAYLITGPRPCLVETGTATSAPALLRALDSVGLTPADLATVVVTHIHLDHAGGVGQVAQAFPSAQVVVHPAGARHLVDPERLEASARRVFGDTFDTLLGPMLPVAAERVVAANDGDVIDLGGGRRLDVIDSPGHAKHHVGLVDSQTGDLYTGDAAGVWLVGSDSLLPATPPPDFVLEEALHSLEIFAARQPTRLLFAHFGAALDSDVMLERAATVLAHWVEDIEAVRNAGADLDHAVALFTQRAAESKAQAPAVLEELTSVEANVHGVWRYLDKRAEQPS